MDQFEQPQEPTKPSQRPDCESRDHPDPLVNDCEDLLRPEVSQEVYEVYKESVNPSDAPEPNWTTIDPVAESQADFQSEPRSQEFSREPEAQEAANDWADQSLDEIKAGLKQISSALKYAFDHGKEDPRLKKFGEDVKDSFNKISDEIAEFFKRS